TAGRRLRHSPAFSCPAGRVGPKALNAIRQLFPIRPSAVEFRLLALEASSMLIDILKAAFLGIVEGLTEYVPVSSTGHLLLLQHFFGFGDEDFGNTFAVLIQLGAILALLTIYFARLRDLAIGMISDPHARRFVLGVLIAFLPAAFIGALLHNFIKGVLFNPWIVCFSLIAGGAVLLYVDS